MVGAQNRIEMAPSTSSSGEGRGAEIVFFDLETTVPSEAGKKFWVLEFGAIVVCPRNLVELDSFCTLIRPPDLTVVRLKSGRSDGITRKAVASAPMFEDVADRIFSILNGRVWAGHNIQRFDCARIKEAFAEIGQPAPVPVGKIDSLGILKQKFGKRAGDMKMATLAAYFGLGEQKHRSLEDVRMNLEILKHCATVLFLESTLPAVLVNNSQGSSTVVTRSRSNGQLLHGEETSRKSHIPLEYQKAHTPLEYPKAAPYVRMSERIKNLMCKAQNKPPLTNFLEHSHSLLR
ncbi:protein NEN4-like [Macadamia integrifolia]|uniref:protein NEN4-like n=1 Tax=Macadamia integrifolia TaxID=60698 RepID=UPI001C4E47AF|nr:protein NEN4-like [Macadamia integrifolia]